MRTHLAAEAVKVLSDRATGPEFFQSTLDSLLAQIAILRADGTIIAVNAAWNAFAAQNGLAESDCGPGVNYLEVCERATGPCSEEAHLVGRGIQEVCQGRMPYFQLEYPCHSPTEQRWFSVRVTRFVLGTEVRIVVTHDNITDRKLAEIQITEVNRLLEAQATTDGLTSVSNRRHFDRMLAQEWDRHTRLKAPLTLMLADIDFFKLYNDSCGHVAGDDCLKAVAHALLAAAGRTADLVARYGGDEFAILLPETDRAGSLTVARSAIGNLRARQLPHPASVVGPIVTMSIGLSTMVPARGAAASEMLEAADRALYQAKNDGRDRFKPSE